jgi:hypothetical protein
MIENMYPFPLPAHRAEDGNNLFAKGLNLLQLYRHSAGYIPDTKGSKVPRGYEGKKSNGPRIGREGQFSAGAYAP